MLTRRVIAGTLLGLALLLAPAAPVLAVTAFADVQATDPYYDAITQLAGRDMIGGYPDGRFGPSDPLIRQQFAKMLVKTLGYRVTGYEADPFADVSRAPAYAPDAFYPDKYITVCYEQGLLGAKTATTFGPLDEVSRVELVTAIARALDLPDPPAAYSPPFGRFAGANYHWAQAAAYAGLLGGLEGMGPDFDLLQTASRAEGAQVLYNLLVIWGQRPVTTTATITPSPAETQPAGQTAAVTAAGPASTTVAAAPAAVPESGRSFWTSPLAAGIGAAVLAGLAAGLLLMGRARALRKRLQVGDGAATDASGEATPGEKLREVLHEWAEANAGSPSVPVTEEDVEDAQAWDHLLASSRRAGTDSDASPPGTPDARRAKARRSRFRRPRRLGP